MAWLWASTASWGSRTSTRVDEMVYQHCMYATTCEIAGIPVPPHVEFPSLKAMAMGEQAAPLYDAMFGWLNVLQRSLRTREHKLIFYIPIRRYQLLDLSKDPWEMHDVIDDPAYSVVKTSMIAKLKAKQAELGDPVLLDSPPHVGPGNSY